MHSNPAPARRASPNSRHSFLYQLKRNRVAYAYIAPFFVLFAVFGLFPIAAGLYLSFYNWDGIGTMLFVGIRNYARLLTDPMFWKALYNTAYIGVFAHIFILGGGLVLAYILNSDQVKRKNSFKTIYFLPVVTSSVVVAIVFQALFGTNSGLINYALRSLGFAKIDWWGGRGDYIKPAIIAMFAWRWIGWNMVIYLAGMQGISRDLYEAAEMDGARHGHVLFRITVPILRPIILFTIVQSVIGTINLFTEPLVLVGNQGGQGNQGLTVMMYLLNKAPYGNNLYGYASACAYVLCAIIVVVSLINVKVLSPDEGERPKKRRA